MELFLIARWLVILCLFFFRYFPKIRTQKFVCRVEEKKRGHHLSVGNGQHPAINQTAGGSVDVVQHIRFSPSLVEYDTHKSRAAHSSLSRSILSGTTLKRPWAPSEKTFFYFWRGKKAIAAFDVSDSRCVVSVYPCANKNIWPKKEKHNWDILSGHDTPIFGAWQLTSREREKSRAVDSISRGMTIDYFFFVFRLLSLSSF
jgi:hypothetical protein